MMPGPPKRVERLLERLLPEAERTELIGDLNEEFAERVVSGHAIRARWWYLRHAVALLLQQRKIRAGAARVLEPPPKAWADLGADFRYGWRSLLNAPVFSSVAILSLIISYGLSTAVFSIANTVLLEPLPIATANRVVRLGVGETGRQQVILSVGGAPAPQSIPDVLLGVWMADTRTLDAAAIYGVEPQTIAFDDETMRADVSSVSSGFFTIMPVRPLSGRTLQALDWSATAPKVAVVSARLVGPRHADSAYFVGRSIAIDGVKHEVVGVLPADFEWPSRSVDVWVVDRWRPRPPGQSSQMFRTPLALGLMRADVGVDDVQREGQRHADRLTASGTRLSLISSAPPVVTVMRLKDELIQPVRPALLLLVGGTIGVLLAANVTLIGFLVGRNTARRRDLAVRQALGASGWRVVRTLLAEQAWLNAIGLCFGLGLAFLILTVLPLVAPPDLPRLDSVRLTAGSFIFGAVVATMSAFMIGAVPALRVLRGNLRMTAAEGGGAVAGSQAADLIRSRLIVTQVAVATVLLVGSVLVGRSLMTLIRIDLGYRPAGVLTFQLGTTQPSFAPSGPVTQFYEAMFARIRALPSVISVGTSNSLPLHGQPSGMYRPADPNSPQGSGAMLYTQREYVSPDYLQTLGATLVAGRFFTDSDRAGAQEVVIVNELYVRTFLSGGDPIGQAAPFGVHRPVIVGVVAPIQRAAATDAIHAVMYHPAGQTIEAVALSPGRGMGVAVRTSGDPIALAPGIRAIVDELAPGVPIHNLMSLDQRVATTYAQPRFFAIALGLFSVLALGTMVLGVYGTLAASVERRRVELGVRRALGATARDLSRLIVGQAVRLAAIGLVLGIGVAAAAATWGRSALYGITPIDANAYAGAAAGILAVVFLGAWVPLRTALRVDPARVLRSD
jgi:putative ABC transport system permease protein